ncbi:MAG: hypothetical protein DWQ18_05680 [Crenarchaeota archaeon]|nr:MAG: hypothetical protein DWQ17_07455 [Thermoproteota archaeon]RDJ33536.1 MAG: hypothetical protein DWQ18_05680 [Thermoproteota archaeon]RDJ38144.1 MAG: hypothetical protein DWQ19_01495 [Thermoproteota archaeon]RDJ39088.1 MAG: hypothetical protein DWQ13_02175 [Thermoproteota archaeon]
MKNKFYVIIPIVAFVVIFLNAFFGHLIFSSGSDETINKYSIYVHLQPEWNSYPGNILFDVTTTWKRPNADIYSFDYDTNLGPQEQNFNQLEFLGEKSFIELQHEFSNCESSWKPILYRYAIDTVRNRIEYFQGNELNGDPYASSFPIKKNLNYDLNSQNEKIRGGYVQFVPICTDKETTSYEFSLKINDKKNGFDVYFVPSKESINEFVNGESFSYYSEASCFGQNYQSFNGYCNNVDKDSGLMIVIPDEMNLSLTKVVISLIEK